MSKRVPRETPFSGLSPGAVLAVMVLMDTSLDAFCATAARVVRGGPLDVPHDVRRAGPGPRRGRLGGGRRGVRRSPARCDQETWEGWWSERRIRSRGEPAGRVRASASAWPRCTGELG